MDMKLGTRIKTLRLRASMTQEQLANRLGVSSQAVSKWESGTNMPDIQLLPRALSWWKKMTEHSPEKWIVWAAYGDCMVKLCRYDEAIEAYRKAMPMRPTPRFTECEEAVAYIYEICGQYAEAVEMYRRMLQIITEDWCTEGEWVDSVYREIHRLEELL